MFNGKIFNTIEEAQAEVMEIHPELLDDDMPDFFDSHIEEIDESEIAEIEFDKMQVMAR